MKKYAIILCVGVILGLSIAGTRRIIRERSCAGAPDYDNAEPCRRAFAKVKVADTESVTDTLDERYQILERANLPVFGVIYRARFSGFLKTKTVSTCQWVFAQSKQLKEKTTRLFLSMRPSPYLISAFLSASNDRICDYEIFRFLIQFPDWMLGESIAAKYDQLNNSESYKLLALHALLRCSPAAGLTRAASQLELRGEPTDEVVRILATLDTQSAANLLVETWISWAVFTDAPAQAQRLSLLEAIAGMSKAISQEAFRCLLAAPATSSVRNEVIFTIRKLDSSIALEFLTKIARNDSEGACRIQAISAISLLKNQEAATFLIDALVSPGLLPGLENQVRAYAIRLDPESLPWARLWKEYELAREFGLRAVLAALLSKCNANPEFLGKADAIRAESAERVKSDSATERIVAYGTLANIAPFCPEALADLLSAGQEIKPESTTFGPLVAAMVQLPSDQKVLRFLSEAFSSPNIRPVAQLSCFRYIIKNASLLELGSLRVTMTALFSSRGSWLGATTTLVNFGSDEGRRFVRNLVTDPGIPEYHRTQVLKCLDETEPQPEK